jgi:hypothetical protein
MLKEAKREQKVMIYYSFDYFQEIELSRSKSRRFQLMYINLNNLLSCARFSNIQCGGVSENNNLYVAGELKGQLRSSDITMLCFKITTVWIFRAYEGTLLPAACISDSEQQFHISCKQTCIMHISYVMLTHAT